MDKEQIEFLLMIINRVPIRGTEAVKFVSVQEALLKSLEKLQEAEK